MKIKKIVISCKNKNILKKVAGQQPVAVFAKKSIANFGIREAVYPVQGVERKGLSGVLSEGRSGSRARKSTSRWKGIARPEQLSFSWTVCISQTTSIWLDFS